MYNLFGKANDCSKVSKNTFFQGNRFNQLSPWTSWSSPKMFRWLWKFVYIYNNFDQTRISNLYFVEVENSTSQSSEYVLQRKLEGCYLTLKNSLLKILKEAGMLIW